MRYDERVNQLPPYLFAELERKIAEKRAAGVDVISLGIGDPDIPTFPAVVEEMQRQVARSDTHQYPSNRGRAVFRQAVASFYERRFGVTVDPETFPVFVDGVLATCEPAREVPLARRYMLR